MTRVLFVNNPPRQCGVYNHGLTTANAIRKSARLDVSYVEMEEETDLALYRDTLARETPDVVILNWHRATMRWLDDDFLAQVHRHFPHIRHLALAHDEPPPFRLLSATVLIDPTAEESEREFRVRRFVPEFMPTQQPPDNVIGWFGFAAKHKGVIRVVEQVNAEFDDALVRLHIPFNYYGDREGELALKLADRCRKLAKPGIRLEITHDYKTTDELIEWLSGNSINCYLYDDFPVTAISSAVDYALAARRPIAVSDSNMFRHILKLCPGVRLSARSLKEIIQDGFAPLEPIRQDWCEKHLMEDYERIIKKVMSKQPACDIRGNRIITHVEVATLQPAIDEIQALEPDMLEGKSSLAVAQNAYIFQQVKMAVHRDDDILLVGGHGDPTGPALQKQGYSVRIIDPRIDGNEARNIWLEMLLKTGRLYDMIVCSSVMEHVPDDVSFIYHLYALLKPGGIAFLTAPFLEPEEDFEQDPDSDPDAVPRQYSLNRLENICKHLPERTLFDLPTWEWCDLDVARQEGGFCSLAFRKSVKSPGYEVIGEHRLAGLVYSLGQEMEILRGIIRSLQTPPPPTRTQKIKRFLKTPFVKSR